MSTSLYIYLKWGWLLGKADKAHPWRLSLSPPLDMDGFSERGPDASHDARPNRLLLREQARRGTCIHIGAD